MTAFNGSNVYTTGVVVIETTDNTKHIGTVFCPGIQKDAKECALDATFNLGSIDDLTTGKAINLDPSNVCPCTY